jgi:hypothetical protein
VWRVSAVAGVWAQRECTLCFTVYPPYMILTSYVGVTVFESRPGYWTVLLLLLLLLLSLSSSSSSSLLQLSFHSVAIVLTQVQTKQIRINIHKRNNTKTVQTVQNTTYTSTHITNTPTQLLKHPPHTLTHTLQNKFKQKQYKTHQIK